MILTSENYFSFEADREYISVSQYKDFIGSMGKLGCEERALAKLSGQWEMPKTSALLVGSYVDAHFEGTLDVFKAQHPEIFTRSGDLKAEYRKANDIINRIERDELFMMAMSGAKQIIMTGEIGGAKWKCKIDSYIENIAIVDLKVMKSLTESFWVKDADRMDFMTYWGYDIQAAAYQEIVRQNTGKTLPFYIAAASKETEPDIGLYGFTDEELKEKLLEVEANTPKIVALKSGEVEPIRCERCDYCKHTKILKAPVHHSEILMEV
ncbi:hypothetical protein J2S20_002382 [Moryella indoligenes]|uniref:Putative exodeoxyribonuclease 8 PDDEXK-like domain-containing protein n=1 Tax=Moryella indoligenes TaxID=371674 RepID=A0AAE3VCI1_9FIRM|nr:PD-(D/E)XK nuclease-like domain-containing protein [Moryella indoligenes]MDQ0153660.1 hypothetical protein [Moryella indoligenes]